MTLRITRVMITRVMTHGNPNVERMSPSSYPKCTSTQTLLFPNQHRSPPPRASKKLIASALTCTQPRGQTCSSKARTEVHGRAKQLKLRARQPDNCQKCPLIMWADHYGVLSDTRVLWYVLNILVRTCAVVYVCTCVCVCYYGVLSDTRVLWYVLNILVVRTCAVVYVCTCVCVCYYGVLSDTRLTRVLWYVLRLRECAYMCISA